MRSSFATFAPGEPIALDQYLRNRKLKKYFNRETSACIAVLGPLVAETHPDVATTPIYYATGLLEYEDYGLAAIACNSLDETGAFSYERFVNDGIAGVSPLNQFKVLQNMPLSFIAIEFGFTGDNAVIYSTAFGLVASVLSAPWGANVIFGAGKVYADGSVEAGFCFGNKEEVSTIVVPDPHEEAVGLIRRLAKGDGA